MFVVYNRQKERHFPKADPYDDVRENIINYDDEGGGEDDMTAFDITPLQIPIAPAIGNGGPLLGKIPCKYWVRNIDGKASVGCKTKYPISYLVY